MIHQSQCHLFSPPRGVATQHPAVSAFYYEHETSLGDSARTTLDLVHRAAFDVEYEEVLLSLDPPRVCAVFRFGDDVLSLTVDEEANVVDVSRGDGVASVIPTGHRDS